MQLLLITCLIHEQFVLLAFVLSCSHSGITMIELKDKLMTFSLAETFTSMAVIIAFFESFLL